MYETFLHIFFWVVIVLAGVGILAGLALWFMAKMMSDRP